MYNTDEEPRDYRSWKAAVRSRRKGEELGPGQSGGRDALERNARYYQELGNREVECVVLAYLGNYDNVEDA